MFVCHLGAFSLPADARIWCHGCCTTMLIMLLQFVLHWIRAWCSGESWYQDRKLQSKPFSMEKLSICRREKRRKAGTWTYSYLVFCWLFSANDPSKFDSRDFIMSLLKKQTFHCSSAHDSKHSTHPQRAQSSPWLPLFPWEANKSSSYKLMWLCFTGHFCKCFPVLWQLELVYGLPWFFRAHTQYRNWDN